MLDQPDCFCKCQPYSGSWTVTLIFCITFIILFSLLAIKVFTTWFIFKDYYPLKERSPILCILLGLAITFSIINYPVLYTVYYYTLRQFQYLPFIQISRSIELSLDYMPYLIYFVRCMRIVYAHQVHISRNKSLIFKVFKKQFILAGGCCLVSLLRIVPLVAISQYQFKMTVEKDLPDYYLYRIIFESLFWQLLLIYCLWLQRKVSAKYSMKKQLLLIIFTEIGISVVSIIFGYRNDFQFEKMCKAIQGYPPTEIIKMAKLLFLFFISLLLPLSQTKIYHRLLPTGRQYGFIKTMRDFLIEDEFRSVFSKFLNYLDGRQGSTNNSSLLDFWKRLMVIRFDHKSDEKDKLDAIQETVNQMEQTLFPDRKQLVNSLKDSIFSLQDSSQSSELMKTKYRESINEKIDELEKIALERLDKIFVNDYRETESYYNLREITKRNKDINLNMIMLNMVLIVDSENQFV